MKTSEVKIKRKHKEFIAVESGQTQMTISKYAQTSKSVDIDELIISSGVKPNNNIQLEIRKDSKTGEVFIGSNVSELSPTMKKLLIDFLKD